ncbi:methylated-DNA--[protein]-cysteine S-methyltransferase [Paenibacillus roseipurpureus]|uniref:methylated-DNA--[protein]-cysteine S-methyltransferase n=1 Tax=Paenibacillus roseopurpureus TaxID=2918901 RepID=A0AA96LLU8_9BACL|nr:methylated-DNA--[protein]-cysteine S-methyltransferase [Paenibacillus sp. MBLB1832]WNR44130.1 methylated-DNA--[protein]-cysteine S-methyltransferase [Paenibacillus sp. MBLB1832]
MEKELTRIYWSTVHLHGSNMVLAATDKGLCYVQFQNGDAASGVDEAAWQQLINWGSKLGPQTSWVQDSEVLQPYVQELDEYLAGKRSTFTLRVDLRGTAFQQAVWQALNTISHGETVSYSQVAQSLGRSSAVRAVGTAIGANPVLIVVPCHRVLGKDGALTGYRGGLANKEKLLRLERAGI